MKREDITALFPDIEKEKLDKIMGLNGADVNAAKAEAETLRGQLSAAQARITELESKTADNGSAAKIAELTAELEGLKAANSLREIREKVSKDTGVPASLLTAETEEACKSQAEAIKAYAQPQGYPAVRDGGEVRTPGGGAARDKFAGWMEENFPASTAAP